MFSGVVGTLALRDVLQGFLPAAIAMALLLPSSWLSQTEITIAAVVIGAYFVVPWFSKAMSFVYRWLPVVSARLRSIQEEAAWHRQNWDWNRLFYGQLSDEERQHLYLVAAYVEMYRASSGLFLLAAVLAVAAALGLAPGFNAFLLHPIAFAVVSIALWGAAVAAFLQEYRRLIVSEYVEWSLKYQRQDPGIALRFWGSTTPGASVTMTVNNTTSNCVSDAFGRFAFPISDADAAHEFRLAASSGSGVRTTAKEPRVVLQS